MTVTVATGIVVPLISATLAGLVAWIVARRTAQTARENWLLDKRYTIYESVVDAIIDMLRQAATSTDTNRMTAELLEEPTPRGALLSRLTSLELVAPKTIRDLTQEIIQSLWAVVADNSQADEFWRKLDRLVQLLREDLTPQHMR